MNDPRMQHIVVLMMENRSFDHMLGLLKTENAAIRGVVGGDYVNINTAGVACPVTDGAAYQGQLVMDPNHDFADVYLQMYGVPAGTAAGSPNMSGFARSYDQQGGAGADVMRCFRPEQLPALTALARQYVVCDQWFASVPGPTLPNRAFVHFGTSFGRLDMSPDYFRARPSIFQRLKNAGTSGRIYYYAEWSGTLGLTFLLSDQRSYFRLWGDFEDDCRHNRLPAYAFVEPAYSDNGGTLAGDQHPDHNVRAGDDFIRAVYTAIRSNEDLWKSTLLIVVWDEHGGLFDHEIPPIVGHPDGFVSVAPPFAFDRLGVRVPALVVSPYVEAGVVDHTVYEHATVPGTVTEQFLGDPQTAAPFKREQFANTLRHLLTRPAGAPRLELVDFDAVGALAAAAHQPTDSRPASSLHMNQVREVHHVLVRHHPEVARTLNPSAVVTEGDAAAFIARGMAAISPDANPR